MDRLIVSRKIKIQTCNNFILLAYSFHFTWIRDSTNTVSLKSLTINSRSPINSIYSDQGRRSVTQIRLSIF